MANANAVTKTATSGNEGRPASSHTGKEPEPYLELATHIIKDPESGAPLPARGPVNIRQQNRSAMYGAIFTIALYILFFWIASR